MNFFHETLLGVGVFDRIRRYAIAIVFVVGFVGGVWLRGLIAIRAEAVLLKQQNAAVAEALQIERRAVALGQKLAAGEQVRANAREVKSRVVTREVVRYVEREKARAAAGGAVVWLDADWVRGHDLAAAPPGAGAEPVPVGEAGPATAGAALTAVSANYEQCYRWRDQVIGWQEWWGSGLDPGSQ